MNLRTLKQARIKKGTRVLARVDFDVLLKNGKVADDFRIRDALPALRHLLQKGARLRIITHLGRPGGRKSSFLSARPVAKHLERLLKKKVVFIADPFDRKVFNARNSSRDILFFENIRFWPGEEKNSGVFASQLAQWGDLYVNEAFANSHRRHASMGALAKILPSFAGFNFAKEIHYLNQVLSRPRKPAVLVLGGAKLETKLPLLKKFWMKGFQVIAGGVLANTILNLQGVNVGKSVCDRKLKKMPAVFSRNKSRLHLPADARVAAGLNGISRISKIGGIKSNEIIRDIGPRTIAKYISVLRRAKTIIWNGPLGYAEIPKFARGTFALAKALKNIRALKIVGGGDTVAALDKAKLFGSFPHISSGGGAMLEFLAGEKLPAVEVLKILK